MGSVRKLWIEGPAGQLEAALRTADVPRGVALVAHPHPLHGGTLQNPVVFHAERELHRVGFTTLRFNFRGVGASQGSHNHGSGEIADVASAASWLRAAVPGAPLLLFGYSFGALCVLRHGAADRTSAGIIAIGLPLRLYTFPEIESFEGPLAVVQAQEDELGRPSEIEALFLDAAGPRRLYEVVGTGHLFTGRAVDAASRTVEAAEWVLSRPAPAPAGPHPRPRPDPLA